MLGALLAAVLAQEEEGAEDGGGVDVTLRQIRLMLHVLRWEHFRQQVAAAAAQDEAAAGEHDEQRQQEQGSHVASLPSTTPPWRPRRGKQWMSSKRA